MTYILIVYAAFLLGPEKTPLMIEMREFGSGTDLTPRLFETLEECRQFGHIEAARIEARSHEPVRVAVSCEVGEVGA